MSTVLNLLKAVRQTEVYSLGPEDSVEKAVELMVLKNIGSVVVTDEGKLLGMVSERDLCRKVLLPGKSISTKLSEVMSLDQEYVTPYTTLEECESLMASLNARHLPVVEKGKVVGIVSIKDILVTSRQDEANLAMFYNAYITGRPG